MNSTDLAREWYRVLTPIFDVREAALFDLRVEWTRADKVQYKTRDSIPYDCERGFHVLGKRPEMSLAEVPLNLATQTVPIHRVTPNKYAAPDGRPLFYAGRCPETQTVYVSNIDPPIDYDRLGPDLIWMWQLWDRCGRHVAPAIEAACRALGGSK